MKKLLFVGDFIVTTGFSRVNHNVLERLNQAEWEVHIVGVNVSGDPNPYQTRFPFQYPASLGGDVFGFGRIGGLVQAIKPDLVFLHQDSWNVQEYIARIKDVTGELPCPVIAWMPVDAPNQMAAKNLNDLALAIAPTQFGIDELVKGGYRGKTAVIPYGVDCSIYHPMDREEARRSINFPKHLIDAFIVGRADRNAPRKRHDLTLKYFAEWWRALGRPDDVYLYLHCATKDVGFDLEQLSEYNGIAERVIFTGRDLHPGAMGSEERLRRIMCSWDVHLSTTLGEGFGLVALDSMACGIPQILPRWSGYGSWLPYSCGVMWAECDNVQVHTQINTIGGVVSGHEVKDALTRLHGNPLLRAYLSKSLLATARAERFTWMQIAEQFTEVCRAAVA